MKKYLWGRGCATARVVSAQCCTDLWIVFGVFTALAALDFWRDCNAWCEQQGTRSVVLDLRGAAMVLETDSFVNVQVPPLAPHLPVATVVNPASLDLCMQFVRYGAERGFVRAAFTDLDAATAWAKPLGQAMAAARLRGVRPPDARPSRKRPA